MQGLEAGRAELARHWTAICGVEERLRVCGEVGMTNLSVPQDRGIYFGCIMTSGKSAFRGLSP